jgi:hypothetical protein
LSLDSWHVKTNSKKKHFMSLDSYSIKVQNKPKLPVFFSTFIENHKMKIHNIFIELLFLWMLDFISLNSLNESRFTFRKIHKNIFMSIYKIDPRLNVNLRPFFGIRSLTKITKKFATMGQFHQR